jgi:phosphatidylglycerophosphate synthase
MKCLADILTSSRAFIAVAIVLLGFEGKKALEAVVILTIIGWTTDIIDGRLARRAGAENTWIGDHDFTFDMIMAFAGLVYLTTVGFIPLRPAAIYTLIAAAFIAFFRSKSVTELFAFPVVALPLIVAYHEAPRAAYLFIAWIILALIFAWRSFTKVVSEFIENIKKLRHT